MAQKRAVLAQGYLARLRDHGLFHKPLIAIAGRNWENFFIVMHSLAAREALRHFLQIAKISSGEPCGPFWQRDLGAETLPGVTHFFRHALALPFFAGLADYEQKRVINRLHRWAERYKIGNSMKINK